MRLIALKLCWHNPSSKSSRLLIGGNLYIRIPPRLSLSFPVRSSLRSGYQWSPFLLWWHVSAIHFHLHGSELYTTVGYFTWSRGRGLIQLWRELDRGDLLKFYSYFCVSVGVMMMLGSFVSVFVCIFVSTGLDDIGNIADLQFAQVPHGQVCTPKCRDGFTPDVSNLPWDPVLRKVYLPCASDKHLKDLETCGDHPF